MPKRKASSGSQTGSEGTMPPKQRMRQTQSSKVAAVIHAAAPSPSDIAASESKGSNDHSVINTETEGVSSVDQVDSDSDIEEYSSMKQPPLIEQLKTILAEYPDDGQIIKELLQNAEDAGASEVKILYDDRCINMQEDNKRKCRKFLRGPALCFFNNAIFTESDWKRIKMIYSSVKKEDSLKVGRFGLGFKSVFHITDHPVVLSGDRILFMDPHENPDCVCLTIKLSKLQKWKKLNIEDFFLALDGTFGVSRQILQMGMYSGTLFWFPLRSKASNLSDTVYNREKVMDLFTSFRTEASSILVFLKHLTKVALHERKNHTKTTNLQFTVEIVKNGDRVREFRNTFLTKIKRLNKSIPQNSIDCRYCLSFCTKSFDGDSVMEEINNDWKVINYYKGGSMSEELRALIQDDSLGYCPLVGVAAPMGQNHAEFKGHVYCFLPLPQKTKSMTGLPVHVNGFFALSQNRRHIKWPSAEQDAMHLHRDKSLLWNEKLLMELLPDVYDILITEMINDSIKMGNPDDLVQSIYETIPRPENVLDEWKVILPAFFTKMTSRPALMTVNKSGDKSWIHCSDAFFATFCKYPNLSPTVRSTLVKVLQMYNKKYVDVPLHVFESFSKFNNRLTDMNPQSFATVLKENSRYKSLSKEYKLDVLEFLTLDCCYEILDSLELLPLQDGSFSAFASKDNASDQVFLCRKEEIDLFPGLEKKFVHQGHQNQCLLGHMQAIVKQGLYQVHVMDVATFQHLLEKITQEHLGPAYPPKVESFSILSGGWIKKIWKHIFSHGYDVSKFNHIPLIPLLKSGSLSDVKEMELYRLTDFLIVKKMQNIQRLHNSVYSCLELLSIKILPSLPLWLRKEQILIYIHYPTECGVIKLLGRLFNSVHRENIISNFNRSSTVVDKEEFIKFLSGCKEWPSNSLKFVQRLKLFTQSGSDIKTVSIQENSIFINVTEYPVKFPRPFLIGSYEECRLARTLGATELDRKTLITETLKIIQTESYSFSEKQVFMQYIMRNMREFEHEENILSIAKTVAFLKSNLKHSICTPANLFDPSDSRLLELFQGENRFPDGKQFQTDTDIMALKKLGLKTYNNITEIELYETARLLETWCEGENESYIVQKKAKRFLEVLKDKPTLLSKSVQGCALNELIMELRCILHAEKKDQNFPIILPWFQQQKKLSKPSELRLLMFSKLVGSTMPLIDCQSEEVAEILGWNLDLPINKVVEQLRLLINTYKSCYKPELLSIINEIYLKLAKYSFTDLCADINFQNLLQRGCIWRGDGFSPPQEIYLESHKTDLDLTPYLYKLPKELKELRFFFLMLGCNKEQNCDVLLKTQVIIKEKYSSGQYSHDVVKRDLSVLISILNRMRQEKSHLKDRLHEIIFPIHCNDVSTLVMKRGSECTYCNAHWLRDMTAEDEEGIYYVHEDISNMTAKELGVKSLTQQLLSDTEAIEEWGQGESLTARLHRLIKEGYQDGFSVPKEIVQNADDAGAKRVYFLYDERENEDAKINLLDEGMAECQGAAFWAYNDAQFQEKDFKNITKLNGATKEDELETIGKFGLGFCSVYNLTDVPSFISGSNIVILDPHKSHLGKALPGSSPGMRIDFGKMKNQKMMKRLKNQFKPFDNVFGCKISYDFQGTLFRFPLRTASQAQTSEINNKYYSKKECQKLLHMTIQAAGNLLLFTQHIQEIKIFHLPKESMDPKEAKLVYSLTKEHSPGQAQKCSEESILVQASKLKLSGDLKYHPLNRLQKITIKEKLKPYAASILPSLKKEAGVSLNTSWLIAWATGTDVTLTQAFNDVAGALPLGAVAVPYELQDNQFIPMQLKDLPFGFYTSGHLFCFLPLPISSDLPVHINGCFAVTSDRRQLMTSTEDDKKAQCSSWNDALIGDALVNAYILLLERIRENKPPMEYKYYSLWPLQCPKIELPIIKHFYNRLLQLELRLFHQNLHWQSFSKCVFLDPSLRNERVIGEIAFETMQVFHSRGNSVVMELPSQVLKNLETLYPDELRKRIMSKEEFFLSVFLPNIEKDFWSQSMASIQKRDRLIIYSLRFGQQAVNAILSVTSCIPSEPKGTLKRPTELVNPLGNLRYLFNDDDEVFPRGNKTFRQKKIVELLLGLGMMDDYLPFPFLENRCQSVAKLAQTCGQCAIERCSKILKYLSGYSVQEKLEKKQEDLQKLRIIPFLPALQKPSEWHFSWKEDVGHDKIERTCHIHYPSRTVKLYSSTNLFRKCTEKLVGCVELVLDETSLASAEASICSFDVCTFFKLKGLNRNDIPYKIVVRQLKTIAEEYKNNHSGDTTTLCKNILDEIYLFLDEACEKSEEIRTSCLKDLLGDEVLLLGNHMLDSSRVAFSLRQNCSPALFGLQNTELAKYRHFLKAIGTKEHFDVPDITTVLGDKRKQWGQKSLSEKNIDLIHGLLSALQDAMVQAGVKYTEIDESLIVAPDIDGVLRETSSLCLDDSEFETSPDTKIVHCSISSKLALALGVKTKRRKCFDELSCLILAGQKEKLVNRLRGILDAYPCDEGIMKELLQNADDAQATEIHFIKDYRTHGCKKIFDDNYLPLQGPALCVFNNSAFTKADIDGIHCLGLGSKREDPLKTGQYGVGFNAVYHLTDAPSFLTKGPELEHGEILCVFDPSCQFLPKVTEQNPGVQCVVSKIRRNYPDVLTGYLEKDLLKSTIGTIFRFPLRSRKTPKRACISPKPICQEFVNKTLETFCNDSFEVLLFVKHVCKITVSNISSGKLREEYKVETVISMEDKKKRDEFFQHVKNVSSQYKKDRTSIIDLQSREVGYKVTVWDSHGRSRSFYVVQRIGFKDGFSLPKTVVHALQENNLGQLPLGGVAVIIPNCQELIKKIVRQKGSSDSSDDKFATRQQENNGRVFCFLPLPLRTGLPCHINGHFVLDHEARRSLWKEDTGYRHDWNHSLFESIISPAYVAALLFLKQHIFESDYKPCSRTIDTLLDVFHSHFPLIEMAKEDDFKAIVRYFYGLVVKDEVPVFPIVREAMDISQKGSDRKAISLDWTALRTSGHRFPAFFHKEMFSLAGILKNLGMKLIDSPLSIKNSVNASVDEIKEVSPNAVVQFIKSYNSLEKDRCVLEVNVPIFNTRLESVSSVRCVIKYIEDIKNLCEEVNQLPLLVTNDDILRLFSSNQPVINSSFWNLFPHSSKHFLHRDLILSCQSQKFMDSGIFCDLSLQSIIDFLPSALSPQHFKAGKDVKCKKSSDDIPNMDWIIRFWESIYEICFKYLPHRIHNFDNNSLWVNIKALDQWSLLPVQHSHEKSFLLRCISKRFTIIDISSFDTIPDTSIRKALEKLDLPELNTSIFSERNDLQRMILALVASKQKSLELLNCLYYHKEKIRNIQLTPNECNSILIFFSAHMTELRKSAEQWWIQDRIKALPLHITQHGTSTSIDGSEKVFVLPKGMPAEGLGEWASGGGYILLQQNKNLEELHSLLQCTFADATDVYCSMILPRFEVLQKCHHLQHLLFIKEKLLSKSYDQRTFNEKQQMLINVLKSTAFISAGDTMKVASDFYDPYNDVFANMCNKDDFPPSPFNDRCWNKFLKLVGLKADVSESMFLGFAETLAKEGMLCVTGNTFEKKSKILTDLFWRTSTASWENRTIERLSKVKFIPPHIVSYKFSSLCKQYSENSSPICFSQSVPASFEEFCWTSMSLLPTWACPRTEGSVQYLNHLGIHTIPPVEKVILHCQNVCDFQNKVFKNKDHHKCDLSSFKSLLDSLYQYLYTNRDKDPRMKEKLQHTPLVFLPENRRLLPTKNIVINLDEGDILEPYLYEAPVYYGRYYDFFIFLGASKQVSLNHYFFVLESVMQKHCDKRLLPPDMIIVGKAIRNVVKLLMNKPEKHLDLNTGPLYLPNRSEKLQDARSLIVADNGYFEGRLSGFNLDYFIGFNQLEVDVPDPRPVIKALPDHCRPKLLSEVVEEEVDMTEKRDIESAVADDLESFLHCTEFVQGILRLVKHEKTEIRETFTKEDEERIYMQIQDIKIREIKGLYTFLSINGQRIESSKLSKPCFIVETPNDKTRSFTLYFQIDDEGGRISQKDLILQPDGVIDLIKRCTDNFIRSRTQALYAIVDLCGKYQIHNTLDMLKIDPYELPQKIPCSIFPRPGTYVPQEFHAFLEQGFSEFQKHEYNSVAYELEDNVADSDCGESVYIYVRIVHPVGSNEHSGTGIKNLYDIDIGDIDRGHIRVHASKLFKFERKEATVSQELLSSASVPVTSLPFDDTCKNIRNILQEAWTLAIEERKRILRRLLLKWHPDKNIGQEEYCTWIFNNIQEVVSRLDSGQLLDNINVSRNRCDTSNVFTGTTYENLGRRVNRRSAQYRQQHSSQQSTFYQAHSRVHYAGQSSRTAKPAPDLPNATRWIQQAKKDLLSAKNFHPSSEKVPAFNWTCYFCHQATEKALKAAVYATDANKVGLKSHQLAHIASKGDLSHDLIQLATDLELCLGEHTRMRYPDPIYRTDIPALLYTDVQARTALEIAEKVIELVDQYHFN